MLRLVFLNMLKTFIIIAVLAFFRYTPQPRPASLGKGKSCRFRPFLHTYTQSSRRGWCGKRTVAKREKREKLLLTFLLLFFLYSATRRTFVSNFLCFLPVPRLSAPSLFGFSPFFHFISSEFRTMERGFCSFSFTTSTTTLTQKEKEECDERRKFFRKIFSLFYSACLPSRLYVDIVA